MNITKKNECTRVLRYIYTDAERLEIGKTLGQVHADLGQTNADFDRVKSQFKAKITEHEAKLTDLSHKVASGYDMRETRCMFTLDEPKKGMKTLRRADIEEIVEVCEMTKDDFQQEIDLANPVLPAGTGVEKDGSVRVPADGKATAGEQK